jgi:hypothetical protein
MTDPADLIVPADHAWMSIGKTDAPPTRLRSTTCHA